MASLMPDTQVRHSHILAALSGHGALAHQVLSVLSLPPKPPDYRPERLEVYFNSRLVLIQNLGKLTFQNTGFAPNYRPRILSICGDSELLFVKAGHEVLLNRLPQLFVKEWKHYEL